MSLFENSNYQWRETYFVLFPVENRPNAEHVQRALKQLDPRYDLSDLQLDDADNFEAITLLSPDDYAAMDISFMQGEEVAEQVEELTASLPLESSEQLEQLKDATARLEVLHFERVVLPDGDESREEDEFLDPGSLLIVLDRLAQLCQGIVIDPQSGTVM